MIGLLTTKHPPGVASRRVRIRFCDETPNRPTEAIRREHYSAFARGISTTEQMCHERPRFAN